MPVSTPAQRPTRYRTRLASTLLGVALLGGCAALSPDDDPEPETGSIEAAQLADIAASDWAQLNRIDGLAHPPGPWTHQRYGSRTPTRYSAQTHHGRPALHAQAQASNSTLRLRLEGIDVQTARHLSFSWFVPALNEQADLRDDAADDAVARVVLSFDGDRSRWSSRDHVLSELAHLITGEPLPFATLIYVWDNRYPVGSVIPNPHTERIRHLVLNTGPDQLNRWVDQERDVVADFRQAFGEDPGRLVGIGVMSDANNTGASVGAWFGPLRLSATPPTAPTGPGPQR